MEAGGKRKVLKGDEEGYLGEKTKALTGAKSHGNSTELEKCKKFRVLIFY